MHRFENMTIECYDVSSAESSDDVTGGDDVMGEPSFLQGVIPGTHRYVAFASSKSQIGVWDLALRKQVRCAATGAFSSLTDSFDLDTKFWNL